MSVAKRANWYLGALILILLLGLLLRVWFWNDQARAGSIGLGDEDEYYRGAIHILLQGDYYDTGKWLRPPVTSLYLAGAFAVLGVNLPLALLFESVLSLLSIALAATLIRNIFRRKTYAVVGAAAVAFFLPYAAYASRVLSENLFIIFFTLTFVLLERARARLRGGTRAAVILFLSGIALGVSILTRAFLFYFVPLLFFWLWWERRRFSEALRAFVPLALGVVLVITPWTIRNTLVYHQLVLIETEGGYSFLHGTEPGADEQALQDYWLVAYPNSAERQRAQFVAGFENVRRAPLQWIGRMRDKVVGLWHLHIRNLANNGARGATVQLGSVNFALVSDLEYVILMIAALIGIASMRREKIFWPLLMFPLFTTLVGVVTVTSVRIREPLMLSAIVYAVPLLANPRVAWYELRRASRARHAFLVTALTIFFALIYSSSYIGFIQGRFWLMLSQLGQGEPAIRRAVAADRDNVFPYLALGDLKLAQGQPDAAYAAYTQAHAQMANNTDVQAKLIQVARLRGDDAGAQAASLPITQAGWDNLQWYEWAWRRTPFFPHEEINLATPAIGVVRGVYPADTENGRTFRWTLDRADFRVSQPSAAWLTVRLRADQAKSLQVFVDGEFVQTLEVTSVWKEYRVRLKRPARAQTLIELQTKTQVVSVDEPYARGVAVGEMKLAFQ